MNIRDSYIHGADGRGVVKSLFFATAADVQANNALHVNDLVFLLADTLGTQVPLTIPTLNQNTTGYASSLLTVKSTSANNHYLTFVDSNNPTADAESFYTSGDIYFKPSTGVLTVKSVTVSNTFNYSGIGSDTTTNAARKIWFASSSDGTPVVSDNFKYNPSTKTLTVDKISGPTIVIGNTTLYLDGANNVLTPDTVISNTSTNNTIPSSKAVWDAILAGMQANDAMVFKGFLTGGADAAHTAYTPGADRGDTYKVQTAGYINGEYYQVNDTFICTTDGTVAATSSNVSTVRANWGVVEGNGDYLSIHGGTMDGTAPITFTNSKIGLAFPGDGSGFEARIMFQSESYESLTFALKNANSSFIFATGLDLANGSTWSTHSPTLHIKNKSVYINTNIGTGASIPAYTFYVNGGAGFSGGIDMGCPLTISGGCDRKLYFKDTDGEKLSLISFLDKNGSEYGLLGVHGDSNLCWNSNIIYHTGNLPAYPTKSSWNYDDRYVTAVGAGGSGHTNEIYYTKNGSNTYFTVPYASNSGALEGNSLNSVIKRNGSRNCVSMKPATSGAKTSVSGFTVVAHPKTNLGDTYYYLKAMTDIPTGKYLFSIRSSGFSGTDHWVFYFLNSASYGYVDCKNGWSSAIINMPAAISAGSNILIDDSSSGTAANSDTVVFSEWMLTPIDEGTYMPAPEDLVHLYGGLTISGNLTATNFYTTSDRNKKTNISSFSEHIRKFQLKDTEKWHYGVIAQEVEEMFRDGEEGNMTVNYNSVLSFYIGLLENRVKMLEERIRILESK